MTCDALWHLDWDKMMQVQVPAGVVGGQIMTVQMGAQLVQVQVPPVLLAGQSFQVKAPEPQVPMMLQVNAPAATPIDRASAEAAAAGVEKVQRVLKPRALAERASRLQRYLTTVPAPLLRKGPALAHAIRRCPCALLGRGSDS